MSELTWKQRIQAAETRKDITLGECCFLCDDQELAQSWKTCAVGEKFQREKGAYPNGWSNKYPTMVMLGKLFEVAVSNDDIAKAKKV